MLLKIKNWETSKCNAALALAWPPKSHSSHSATNQANLGIPQPLQVNSAALYLPRAHLNHLEQISGISKAPQDYLSNLITT
jgi:hypothetical protein